MKPKYLCMLVSVLPLSCGSDTTENLGKSSQNIVLSEACGPNSTSGPEHDPCVITRTQIDPLTIETRINEPVVDRPSFDYSTIVLGPGDTFTVDASGCVQTGGSGSTWKRYVNPSGDNSDHLYFGSIEVPGVLTKRRVSSVLGQTFTLDANAPQTFVRLSYPDDEYDDNGYWGHDDGTEDQCSFANGNDGGPAHLTIRITSPAPVPDPVRPRPQGSVPPVGSPWDLEPNLGNGERAQFDDNLLPFDPRWQWQTPGASMPDFAPSLSSQPVTIDRVSGYKSAICGMGGGTDVGHANWFDATIDGNIFWIHHDSGLTGDDDYNVAITSPKITGALPNDPLALVARDNGDAPGFSGTHLVKGEFDSDETVDYDEFDLVPWWRDFHSAVDDSDDSARSKMDGHRAILTGLAGLDLVHGTASEIHPVHAVAIRQTAAANAGDDAWSIFVRNFGDEGYCSEDQHYLDTSTVTIRLPRPDGVDVRAQASGLLSLTKFVGHNTPDLGPEVFTAPNQDTLVTFHLKSGGFSGNEEDNFSFVVGELHLHWSNTASAQAAPLMAAVAPAAVVADEEDEPEDLLSEAVQALSPAQFQQYSAIVTANTPPLAGGNTVALQAQLVAQPPAIPTSAPHQVTGPANHLRTRDLVRLTTLCQLTGGKPLNLPNACQTIAPTTTIVATPIAGVSNCFAAPVAVSLSASDASGTGIDHVEYSLDGQTFVTYKAPFFASPGVTISYRARDRAGNLEATKTFSVGGDTSGFSPSGAAVFTSDALLIDDGTLVSASATALGSSATLVNAGLGQTNIGSAASVLDVLSRGQVVLRDRARVGGNIQTSQPSITRQNNVVVTGSVATGASLTLPNLGACTATFPTFGSGLSVPPDSRRSLAPGAYADTSIQSRSTVTLTAGTYYFSSLDLEPQAQIVLDQSAGPIVLLVKNSAVLRGRFVDPSGAPTAAVLLYFGTQRLNVETAFLGTVIAPNAYLSLAASGSTYVGSFFAKDFEIAAWSTLKH